MRFKKLKAEIEELEDKLTTNEDLQETIQNEQKEIINEMKKIGIEKLPYAYSALKQFIDAETMNYHYNKVLLFVVEHPDKMPLLLQVNKNMFYYHLHYHNRYQILSALFLHLSALHHLRLC